MGASSQHGVFGIDVVDGLIRLRVYVKPAIFVAWLTGWYSKLE